MQKLHILDACALLAYFDKEPGESVVANILERAKRGEITLTIHAAQVIEVFYDLIRSVGLDEADKSIKRIYDEWPITIIEPFGRDLVRYAAQLKATGSMSFADTLLVATAASTGATIVTSDWSELESVEKNWQIPVLWIRPKPNA